MDEMCIRYLKPANVYRYCGPWCSYPITEEEAWKQIASWVLKDGYAIDVWENEWVKGYSPRAPK